MALPNKVYDKNHGEDEGPVIRPDLHVTGSSNPNSRHAYEAARQDLGSNQLRAIDGGGESTPRKTEHLKSVGRDDMSGSQLADAESSGEGEQTDKAEQSELDNLSENGLYKGGDDSGVSQDTKTKRRKKGFLLGGGGAALAGGGLLFFLVVPGMKLQIMSDQLTKRAFGVANNAVEHRMARHMENYLLKKVLPEKRGLCGGVVSTACTVKSKNSIAGQMYSAWSDAKIEDKMLDKLGISIEYDQNAIRADGQATYKFKNKDGGEVHLSEGEIKSGKLFDAPAGGKNTLGKQWRQVIRKQTKWYQIVQRHSYKKLLKGKHDFNLRCYFRCEAKDKRSDSFKSAKTKMKKKLIGRVVYPMSNKYGVIMECIISAGEKCSKTDLNTKKLDKIPDADLDKILDDFNKNPGKKLSKHIIENMMEKALGKIMSKTAAQTTTKAAASAIPIAGQIYLGLTIADLANELWYGINNNTLGKYASNLNARQYVEYYNTMRAAADESKSGRLDYGEIGALVSEFEGSGQSMVYQATQPDIEVAFNPFGSKAFAAKADDHKCANGKPIKQGEKVCDEKKVVRSFFFEDWADNQFVQLAAGLSHYEIGCDANTRGDIAPPKCVRGVVHNALKGVNWVFDTAAEGAMAGGKAIVEKIPGVGDAVKEIEKFATEKTGEVTNAIFEKILPLPVTADSPGRDKYDAFVAGSEQSASDFGKGGFDGDKPYGIGGKQLSDTQTAAILDEQKEMDDFEYNSKSYFARLTDTENPDSVFSKAIMQTPSEPSQFATALVGGFSSLFSGKLFGGFATSSFAKAGVADPSVLVKSPFGITKYGYPLGDPKLDIDPEELTDEKCAGFKKAWEASMKENPKTGFEEYGETNPCMVDRVAVEAGAMMFTNAFDEAGSTGPGSSSGVTGAAVDPNLPTGTKEELIEKIKATGNVTGVGLINTSIRQTTLAVLLKLAEKYKFTMWQGAHQDGRAVDLGNINGNGVPTGNDYAAANDDAKNFARDAATLLPGKSWLGVPNDTIKGIANPIMSAKGGSSDLDTPGTTKATGAHFHLQSALDAP